MYYNSKRYDDAEKSVRRVTELHPENLTAWNLLVSTLSILEKFEEAQTILNKALQRHPDSSDLFAQQGYISLKMGNEKEAVRSYRRVTELAPTNANNWSNLASGLIRMGDYHAAIEALTEAKAADKTEAIADLIYYNFACCHALLGDRVNSLNNLREAITRNPKWKEKASTDKDFKELNDDSEFLKLIS
jgi:predicted Zn-dependent protease